MPQPNFLAAGYAGMFHAGSPTIVNDALTPSLALAFSVVEAAFSDE
jgi:hypothetical protein